MMNPDPLYIYPPVNSQHFPFYIDLQIYNNIEEIFPTHWHEHFEMIFMVDGVLSLTCNGNMLKAVKGDMLIINPNDVHYLYSLTESVQYYCIVFDLSLLNNTLVNGTDLEYLLPISNHQLVFNTQLRYSNQMLAYAIQLYEEYTTRSTAYEMAIKAQLYLLLTALLRSDSYKHLTTVSYNKRRHHIETIQNIMLYLEKHFDQEIKLQSLAKNFGISYHHLCHVFKDYTNKTLIQYLHELRIDKSVYYLENTELSMTEIAHSIGFSDANYFSRVFKKHKQQSPSDYLKNIHYALDSKES